MKEGPPDNDLPYNGSQHAPLDENDPVWRLLGRAPLPEPDAWFGARSMARCRNEVLHAKPGIFMRIWHWALGGGVVLSVAVALAVTQLHVQEAFEIVASMDTDSDTSSSTWQDSSR
jgi:hypothetical protein